MFHRLSKRLEFCQKYSAAHRIFHSLPGVWKSRWNTVSRVWYITSTGTAYCMIHWLLLVKLFSKTIDVIVHCNYLFQLIWTHNSWQSLNSVWLTLSQKIPQSTKLTNFWVLHFYINKVLNLLTFLTLWPFPAKSLNWPWNKDPGGWSPEEVLSLSLSLTEVLKYQQMIHDKYKRKCQFLKFW